jgi:isochorismate hydrolase
MIEETPIPVTLESCPAPTIESLKADLDRAVMQLNRAIWDNHDLAREFREYQKNAVLQREKMVERANQLKEIFVERGDFAGASAIKDVVLDIIQRQQSAPLIPVEPE